MPLHIEIIDFAKRNWKGITLGALAGWLYASTIKDFSFALQSQSILDPFTQAVSGAVSQTSIIFASAKVKIASAGLGAFIGGMLDDVIN